jgi:zinc protease
LSAAPNGARVFVEQTRALPLVSITIAARGGATFDPAGREGACRIMARLVRRTGAGLSVEVLDERIDTLGGSLGMDVGHSTVTLHGTVIGRSLDEFADLVVGVLSNPSFAEAEFERLKRETLAELVEARDNDRHLAERWFRKQLFGAHPYGRPPGGTLATIGSLSLDDVTSLYRKLFVRGNLSFAFAGDVDAEKAHDLSDRVLAALPEGPQLPDAVPEPELRAGRHLVLVDKPERSQTQIFIGCLGTHPHDPDHVALHVASTIFGGTFTARLMKEVRSKRGWSYGAYSNLPYDRHRRGFSLWTFPKASDAAPCVELQLGMLEKWVGEGVTPRELEWAKRYLVRSHAFAIDTASKRVSQALDEALYDLPAGYHARYVEQVRAVTVEQVAEALRTRITPKDLAVSVLGTAKDVEAALRGSIADLASASTVPFDADV